jgi:Family of unknown function (DUF6113)
VFRRIGRVAAYVVLFLLGAVVGAAGSFVQAVTLSAGPVDLPVGLVVALAGCAGLFVAGVVVMRGRPGAVVPAVAWLLVVLLLSVKRPEGDVVLSNGGTAYGYLLIGTMLAAVIAMAAGARLRPAESPARPGCGTDREERDVIRRTHPDPPHAIR